MKTFIFGIVLLWSLGGLYAQKIIDKHIAYTGKTGVELNIPICDSINVLTWDKSEVYAHASININDNKENDSYTVTFDESGDKIRVKTKLESLRGKKNCLETDIRWTIYMPELTSLSVETINGSITIKGNTANITANTISGFIDMSQVVNQKINLELSTISGNIYSDKSFKKSSKKDINSMKFFNRTDGADVMVKLTTISGDIFYRKGE